MVWLDKTGFSDVKFEEFEKGYCSKIIFFCFGDKRMAGYGCQCLLGVDFSPSP